MLTATISECQNMGKECLYQRPTNDRLQRFLNQIGFNKYFGLRGQDPGLDTIATGRVQLRTIKGLDPMFIETMIEIFEHHLNISPGVKGSLTMSLLETMTNVVDHSKSEHYYVCGWTDRRKKEIRLCIADLGIGIANSLRSSDKYKTISDDHEAIKMATDEGVSCRPGRAGLGLNHIKGFLFVNKGQMCIISGSGKVYWKFDRGETLKQTMDAPFNGTVIKWIVNYAKDWFYFMSNEEDYLF
jgi:hypothetical protein